MYLPCACIGLSPPIFSVFKVWFDVILSRFSILSILSNIFSNKTAIVFFKSEMSLCVRKPTICMGENKDADQLRGNREADQRLCFRYTDSTIPLLLKSKISRFYLFSVLVQAGLCQTCSETTLLVFP